ncbi:MAG: copper resistance protein CopC/CopD [Actinobacteria bacterium]|nr:copper resistance protein CopC/CopD [Actinomycetota bacterium]
MLPVVCTALVIVALGAMPAAAHSFLAATEPAAGARLAEPPGSVSLQFSEQLAGDATQLTVRRDGADELRLPAPALESASRVVRTQLPDLEPGIYVVSWHVASAVDDHRTAGEFAFAVGVDDAVPAAVSPAPSSTSTSSLLSTWLFFAGLATAAGGLLGPRLVTGTAGSDRLLAGPGWFRAGAAAALAAALLRAAAPDVAVDPVRLGVVATSLVAGLGLSARPPWIAGGVLLTAAAAWATASHAAANDGLAGAALDLAHLGAAALWAGCLAYLVAVLWRTPAGHRRQVLAGAWAYSRLAAATVGVLTASGIVAAVRLVPSLDALSTTGYGQVLLVKSALLAAALALALLARRRLLPRQRTSRLRHVTSVEAVSVIGALAAAALLVNLAPPAPVQPVDHLLGPAPIQGPTARAAGLAGTLMIDARAGDGRIDLEVLGSAGGFDGASLSATAHLPNGTNVDLRPRSCGAGCFTQELDLPEGDTVVSVVADAPDRDGGGLDLTLTWPPAPEEPDRFDRMVTTMRQVDTVRIHEDVRSGPDRRTPTDATGGGLELGGEKFIDLMPYAGGGVTDVRPRDDGSFSFYLPGSRMLFTVWLDGHGRIARQEIVNPGHIIEYVMRYGDRDA